MAKILIAEDETVMQDIIADYMRRGGHTCFTAGDGEDALMLLKTNPMDLMILDVMMPRLDGFTVCKIAREMGGMPIILLTARSGEEDKLRGYGCGRLYDKAFQPQGAACKGERPPAPVFSRCCRSNYRRENHAPPQCPYGLP